MLIPGILASSVQKVFGSYNSISSVTLGSSSSITTINSIDQSYKHLIIRLTVYGTGSGESNYSLRFNGDSGSNYWNIISVGDGYSQASLKNFADTVFGWGYTYGNYGLSGRPPVCAEFIIPNYSTSNRYKSMLVKEGVTGDSVGGAASLGGTWNSKDAITSVSLLSSGNAMAASTQMSIYGIKGS